MNFSRKSFTLALFVSCLHACVSSADESPHPPRHPVISAEAALTKLQEGNARFAAGKTTLNHTNKMRRDELVDGQHPFAVIVSCSDSRVPTELVFDQGFGDLFIIRNAGNIIATDVLGSIEYAIAHLNCKLVLVMGHESCGAVTAALMSKKKRDREPIDVQDILSVIVQGLEKTRLPEDPEKRLQAGVLANVVNSVEQLQDLLKKRNPIPAKGVRIIGSVYNLHDGKVEFIK